ncbi:MAG: ParB/RepB/Spo0J family partition protein [Burkholderiaceae bacterium]|nr:ParB/RepB/Spo0J family partition protein [Burkholderiaceae bacterium]
METFIDMQRIPLQQLKLSPRNARKTGGKDIAGLAASIAVHGLLQNLTVQPSDGDASVFEVVAGGRRLAALLQLQRESRLPRDLIDVPCKVIADDHVALEASTAENTLREAMHPADQFVAFKGMVDHGKSIEDVAAHFGVQPAVVRQRLKLANVAPQLVEIYRTGGMQLDQLQALALTDDQEQQRKVWSGAKENYQRTADALRKRITKQEIGPDNPLAKFVEPELYQAAGGAIRRDLFTDQVYFADAGLLNTLAKNKIEAIALDEKNAGWSWVEAHLVLDYSSQSSYGHSSFSPKRTDLTPDDKTRVAAIVARIDALEELQDTADLEPTQEDELEALQAEREHIYAKREVWPDEAKARTGVLIYLDQYHGLQIERGRLKRGQRESSGGGKQGKRQDGTPKKPGLSQDMVQRLEMHRAAAIREHVAAQPAVALQLLLTHMLSQLFTNSYAETVFSLSPSDEHKNASGLIQSKFGDLAKSSARKAIDDRIAELKKAGLPTKAADLHAWIGKLTEAKRHELLALAVALTVNTNCGARGNALAELLGVDMTKWWSATPETFIGVVPKALLAEAVADVAGKAEGEAVLLLKKDGAMAAAAKKLAGTGWLPKPLRGARYKIGKPGITKPAAAPPATKAAKSTPAIAKKSAQKANKKPAKKIAKAGAKKATKK